MLKAQLLPCRGFPSTLTRNNIRLLAYNIRFLSCRYLGNYIKAHAAPGSAPFFAYMAFSHTHVPLFFDPKFANSSARKTIFADTTMEMDNTVTEIWQAVKDAGLEEETLFLMTSDNGPWAVKCELAGSAGPYTGEDRQARVAKKDAPCPKA